MLFRLSPAATLGLILLPFAGVRAGRGARVRGWRSAGWLLLFSLLLLLLVTVVAKKHDRYALPALMALTLLAGWAAVMATVGAGARLRGVAFFTPVLLQIAFLIAALPYPLTAYNWLAGGTAGAYRALPAGWGEGASAAARRLAARTGESGRPALFASSTVSTAPFYAGEIYRRAPAYLSLLQEDDFLLVTAGERQGATDNGIEAELQQREAEETVYVNGREQAWLYSGLTAAELGLPSLELVEHGYRFDRGPEIVAGGAAFLPWPQETLVAVRWRAPTGMTAQIYRLQLQVVDDRDQQRALWEVPLLNDTGQPPGAWPAERPQSVYYSRPVPPDLPPGDYRVVATLFDARGAQLGVFDERGTFVGTRAPVATLAVEPPPSQPPLVIPQRFGERTELVGHGPIPETAGTGTPLSLNLWWQTTEQARYLLALSLGDGAAGTEIEPWLLNAELWTPGQTYNIRPRWRLPVELPGDTYPLRLQLLDADGRESWPTPVTLGKVRVETWEREFELPAGLDPLGIEAGTSALLQEVTVEREGSELVVTVVWQARQATDEEYTAFVHLLDAGGDIVEQIDRPLSPPTTSWVPRQVIAESYVLTLPGGGGDYQIAVGLYERASGVGLPLYKSGRQLPDDRYLLEVPER